MALLVALGRSAPPPPPMHGMEHLLDLSFGAATTSAPSQHPRGGRCTADCLALIGVQSVAHHTDRRMRIRQTWLRPAHRTLGVEFAFVLAMKELTHRETNLLR